MSCISNTPRGSSVSSGSLLGVVRSMTNGMLEQCQHKDANINTGEISYQLVSVENHDKPLVNNSTQIKSLTDNMHSKAILPTTGNEESEQVSSIPMSSLVTMPKILQMIPTTTTKSLIKTKQLLHLLTHIPLYWAGLSWTFCQNYFSQNYAADVSVQLSLCSRSRCIPQLKNCQICSMNNTIWLL